MYVRMYACMHVCMYVCMHACMHLCVYVCMYLCVYLSVYVCRNLPKYVIMYVCIFLSMEEPYPSMYVYMYVCMYLSTYVGMFHVYVLMRKCVYRCVFLWITQMSNMHTGAALAVLVLLLPCLSGLCFFFFVVFRCPFFVCFCCLLFSPLLQCLKGLCDNQHVFLNCLFSIFSWYFLFFFGLFYAILGPLSAKPLLTYRWCKFYFFPFFLCLFRRFFAPKVVFLAASWFSAFSFFARYSKRLVLCVSAIL